MRLAICPDWDVVCAIQGTHEDIERLERQIVKEFKGDVKGHKERMVQGHKVRTMLAQIQDKAQQLVSSWLVCVGCLSCLCYVPVTLVDGVLAWYGKPHRSCYVVGLSCGLSKV